MSFKLHLVIISVIIVIVYLVWQLTKTEPVAAPAPEPVAAVSPYSITIIHATLGRNCPRRPNINDSFMSDEQEMKSREDNILSAVANLCNSKLKCDVNAATLNENPIPDCRSKVLEIEYRCFSYDRPWIVKSTSGILNLSCDKPVK